MNTGVHGQSAVWASRRLRVTTSAGRTSLATSHPHSVASLVASSSRLRPAMVVGARHAKCGLQRLRRPTPSTTLSTARRGGRVPSPGEWILNSAARGSALTRMRRAMRAQLNKNKCEPPVPANRLSPSPSDAAGRGGRPESRNSRPAARRGHGFPRDVRGGCRPRAPRSRGGGSRLPFQRQPPRSCRQEVPALCGPADLR